LDLLFEGSDFLLQILGLRHQRQPRQRDDKRATALRKKASHVQYIPRFAVARRPLLAGAGRVFELVMFDADGRYRSGLGTRFTQLLQARINERPGVSQLAAAP